MIDLYFEIRKRICPFKIIVDYIPPQTKILDWAVVMELFINTF